MAVKTFRAKPEKVEQKWYVMDASNKVLGRFASDIAVLLMGKNKVEFTKGVDCGDFVVVINADKVKITGNKYEDKEIAVIGINTLEGEEADFVKSFLEEHNITYCVLLDSENEIVEKYGITKIPACIVLDKKGVVRFSHQGLPSEKNVIDRKVTELLEE